LQTLKQTPNNGIQQPAVEVADSKRAEIESLIRTYDFGKQGDFASTMPPELAHRLNNLHASIPTISKLRVILTGIECVLDTGSDATEVILLLHKALPIEVRYTTSLTMQIPSGLSERLAQFLKQARGISKRELLAAGLILILAKCETKYGGPFPPPLPERRPMDTPVLPTHVERELTRLGIHL
jgi:hypothetical protein